MEVGGEGIRGEHQEGQGRKGWQSEGNYGEDSVDRDNSDRGEQGETESNRGTDGGSKARRRREEVPHGWVKHEGERRQKRWVEQRGDGGVGFIGGGRDRLGAGEASMTWTATEGTLEESGAEDGPGGESAGGHATLEATIQDKDEAGKGGRHGAENRETEGVARRHENSAGKPYRVVETEGVPKAYGEAENSGGGRQGVRGGAELPQGIDTQVIPAPDENIISFFTC